MSPLALVATVLRRPGTKAMSVFDVASSGLHGCLSCVDCETAFAESQQCELAYRMQHTHPLRPHARRLDCLTTETGRIIRRRGVRAASKLPYQHHSPEYHLGHIIFCFYLGLPSAAIRLFLFIYRAADDFDVIATGCQSFIFLCRHKGELGLNRLCLALGEFL